MSSCHLGVGDEQFFEEDTGLHEIRCMIQQGTLKIGHRLVVICLLGWADIARERQFPGVLERLLKACTTFAPDTHVVFGGPFPKVDDAPFFLARLREARHYLESRVEEEAQFHYLGISFCFADPDRGINPRLVQEDGDLTPEAVRSYVVTYVMWCLLYLSWVCEGFWRRFGGSHLLLSRQGQLVFN